MLPALVMLLVLGRDAHAGCAVRHFAEARVRYPGYDHIVHIHSSCDVELSCTVRTNVNPSPVEASVPPHGRVEVLTWRGSPARTFTATVDCARAE
jgi:hypothetical protein